jgi:uncharacterized protein YecA (UPF0149 family)
MGTYHSPKQTQRLLTEASFEPLEKLVAISTTVPIPITAIKVGIDQLLTDKGQACSSIVELLPPGPDPKQTRLNLSSALAQTCSGSAQAHALRLRYFLLICTDQAALPYALLPNAKH